MRDAETGEREGRYKGDKGEVGQGMKDDNHSEKRRLLDFLYEKLAEIIHRQTRVMEERKEIEELIKIVEKIVEIKK